MVQVSLIMPEDSEIKERVRIARTGINGTQPVEKALTALKGVGDMYAHAIAEAKELKDIKIGSLSDDEIDDLEESIKNPESLDLPVWIRNRRRDRETGQNIHIIESELELKQEFDIRRLKETGTYKGWRHKHGLPVRGQKTQSSFREGSKIGVETAQIKEDASGGGEE